MVVCVLLAESGRKPDDVKRSLMTGCCFARNDAEIETILNRISERAGREITFDGIRERGTFIGTASMLVDQIGEFAEAGIERFTLRWWDQDDIDRLELMARDVLPHFHK